MVDNWDEVTVIRKKAETGRGLKSTDAVRSAFKNGGTIISERKQQINAHGAGLEGSKIAKIDRENDVVVLDKVDRSLSLVISKVLSA